MIFDWRRQGLSISAIARNLRRRDHFAPVTTTAQSTIQIVSTRSRSVHNRHLLHIAQLPQHFQQGARIRINRTDEPSPAKALRYRYRRRLLMYIQSNVYCCIIHLGSASTGFIAI